MTCRRRWWHSTVLGWSTVLMQHPLSRSTGWLAVDMHLLCRARPQAENASLSSRLHEVSEQLADREAELRNRLTSNELQLKEQIVYNVSQHVPPQQH